MRENHSIPSFSYTTTPKKICQIPIFFILTKTLKDKFLLNQFHDITIPQHIHYRLKRINAARTMIISGHMLLASLSSIVRSLLLWTSVSKGRLYNDWGMATSTPYQTKVMHIMGRRAVLLN